MMLRLQLDRGSASAERGPPAAHGPPAPHPVGGKQWSEEERHQESPRLGSSRGFCHQQGWGWFLIVRPGLCTRDQVSCCPHALRNRVPAAPTARYQEERPRPDGEYAAGVTACPGYGPAVFSYAPSFLGNLKDRACDVHSDRTSSPGTVSSFHA